MQKTGKLSRRDFLKLSGILSFSGLELIAQDISKYNLDLPYNAQGEDVGENYQNSIIFLGKRIEGSVFAFALDYSSSMIQKNKIDRLRHETRETINNLSINSFFTVILFNEEFRKWKENPVRANADNKKEAINFLYSVNPYGKTLISPSVCQAIKQIYPFPKKDKAVLLVCDGIPTRENSKKCLETITSYNNKRVPINTFYVEFEDQHVQVTGNGTSNNKSAKQLMRDIALSNRGQFSLVKF